MFKKRSHGAWHSLDALEYTFLQCFVAFWPPKWEVKQVLLRNTSPHKLEKFRLKIVELSIEMLLFVSVS